MLVLLRVHVLHLHLNYLNLSVNIKSNVSVDLESFRTAIAVGGTNIADQRSELRAGVDVIVATPRRFIDHLQQGNTSLSTISFIVLDEAGRMLDMGFELLIRE
ncbi:ATP-DEPENDENT RNA HELICASE DBP3, partial [Salix purpurea]